MSVTEKIKEAVGLGHDDHGAPKGRESPSSIQLSPSNTPLGLETNAWTNAC